MPERHDITIYLRAEARAALDVLTTRWGVSRQEAIVRSLLLASGSGVATDA
jgi:hypothetical protein